MDSKKIKADKIHEKDKAEADKICNELRAGRRNAVNPLMDKYHNYLKRIAGRLLYDSDPHRIEETVNNVWIAVSVGYAICNYKGNSALKTYLTAILNNKIKEENRKIKKKIDTEKISESESENLLYETKDKKIKECMELSHESLLRLSESSPKDAELLMICFEGFNLKEIAVRELKGEKSAEKNIERKHNSLRQQFRRALPKFRKIFERLMKEKGLNINELFD